MVVGEWSVGVGSTQTFGRDPCKCVRYETIDNKLMVMQWPSNSCPACAVHEW